MYYAVCIYIYKNKHIYVYILYNIYNIIYIYIWVLIKIKVSRAATIADQPRINRDHNGVNRGRVLSYPTRFCAENRQNIATYHSI